jgi:hypothetical protein
MLLQASNLARVRVISEPADATQGAATGLANLSASLLMNPEQLQRQLRLKMVLDQVLAPDEPYFDATNHQADYGYQGRPIPVKYTSPYNMPSEIQQQKIVRQLEEKQVALALVQSNNLYHDGGTLPLRNYWVYRYLLENFVPFNDPTGDVWMVRQDQARRASERGYALSTGSSSLQNLNSAFWQKDLKNLPAAWGASFPSLSGLLTRPVDLLGGEPFAGLHNVSCSPSPTCDATGPDPFVVVQIPEGAKGDFLWIELDREVPGQFLQLFWTNEWVPDFSEEHSFVFSASGSRFLAPVSAAPSWLLAQSPRLLRIDFPEGFQGRVTIKSLVLYDRLPGK